MTEDNVSSVFSSVTVSYQSNTVRSRSTSPGDRCTVVFVDNLRNQHQREKQELSDLNDRFRGYLDRVKILEHTNTHLTNQLEEISKSWGTASQTIMIKYGPSLDRLRQEMNDGMYQEADAQARWTHYRYNIENYRTLLNNDAAWNDRQESKREQLKLELANSLEELNSLQLSCKSTDEQVKTLIKLKYNQVNELDQLSEQVYQATMDRIKVDLQVQTLREEIPFLSDLYSHVLREFELLKPSNGMDIQLFYRQELQKAIRDIRRDFESLHIAQRKEMEEFYQLKVDELQNDAKKFAKVVRNQDVGKTAENIKIIKIDIYDTQKNLAKEKALYKDLQERFTKLEEEYAFARCRREDANIAFSRDLHVAQESIVKISSDIDIVLRSNITLESEINIYRRLLDGETRRLVVKTPEPVPICEPPPASFGSELGKVFNKKVKRGPIAIKDCSPDGKVVTLENTSLEKDVDVSTWCLKRSVQGQPEITYIIPSNIVMRAGSELRIYSRSAQTAQHRPPYHLLNGDIDSWGMSTKCETRLFNEQDEERASHSQTIVFGSETVADSI